MGDFSDSLSFLSFNASTEQSLFKAFRSELNYTDYPYSFPDEVLSELLTSIKEHHPDVAHLTCSGAGLRLMNIDSRICEYVIADLYVHTLRGSKRDPVRAERLTGRAVNADHPHWEFVR